MLWLLIAAAYLIGSVSGSLCLGKLRGVDIRNFGSGNAGGTNALRTQGVAFALGVVLIDVGKGLLAAWLAQHFLPAHHEAAFACVFAAVIGHIWPLWHGFRGGKGAATLVGGLILVWPQALLLLFAVWILCLLLSAAWSGADAGMWCFAAASALLLTYSHRSNLQRLRAGTENRFEKARLLGRLLSARRG